MSDETKPNQPETENPEVTAEDTLAEEQEALDTGDTGLEAAPEADQQPAHQPAAGARNLTGWLAALALLLALAVVAGLAWMWQLAQQESDRAQSLRDENAAIGQDLQALTSRLDTLAGQQAAATAAHNALQQSLSALTEEIGRDRSAWGVAESQYYLELANTRLQLLRDLPTALQALRLADQRLQSLGDPVFVPVREQLAKEIAALEAVPKVDLTGAAVALGGLAAQVPKLPLHAPASSAKNAVENAAADETPAPAGEESPRWRQEAAKIWSVMRELVQVRRTDKRIEPLLSVDEHHLLVANLQLQLQTARYAVVARDTRLLHDSANTARDWLQRYYDQDDAATRAVLERLEELGQLELAPALPDISGSLRQLRSILNKGKPTA